MPGQRRPGMDHEIYDWSPIISRPTLRWPGGARVAFCVIVNLEHYEWAPPKTSYVVPAMPGGGPPQPYPDIRAFSQREYGNRVGVFSVMEALDKYGLKATVALDATVAEGYPFLVGECAKRGWEFIGHGITANTYITSEMSEEQERRYISTSLEAVAKATGQRPVGWLGPGMSESTRTTELLAQEGIRYVCDWPNDDQPYQMRAGDGQLYSLPVSLELDDFMMLWMQRVPVTSYDSIVREAFDVLYREGEQSGRLLVLNIHPWLLGQPYRVKRLHQALAHISRHKAVWNATGKEIIDWYASHS